MQSIFSNLGNHKPRWENYMQRDRENPLHIVSGWGHNNQMVFTQEKVHEKSNRIVAKEEIT